MRLLSPIFLLALALVAPPAPAAIPDAEATAPAALRQGEEALASGLWEIAVIRFDKLLQDSALPLAQKPRVAIRLAEAWIRSGNSAAALTLLDQAFAAKDPEAYFWKAQALAASGRFAEAVDAFAPALDTPQTPYRREACLSRAGLQLALNQAAAALASLKTLATDPDPTTAAEARLRQAEILFDQGDCLNARATLPLAPALAPALRPQAAFLHACLLLAEAKPAAAIRAFSALVEQPQGQSLNRHAAAAIGLADALDAQDSPAAAANSLLAFIQEHPDSDLLDQMFQRLLQWLPAVPAPTDPILEQLAQWIPPLPPPAAYLINANGASAVAAWPLVALPSNLAAYAFYTRALGLQRIASPEAKTEARHLLTRLRLEYPAHVLASRSLLQAGRWLLDDGHTSKALTVLAAVRDSARSPVLSGEAAFLAAQAAFAAGDSKQAVSLFEEAATVLTTQAADTAYLNAALARLQQGELVAISSREASQMTPATLADLALEQALAATPPAAAKSALAAFISSYPDHPRLAQARLAAADAALSTSPPDLVAAHEQLDALAVPHAAIEPLPPVHLALTRLRLTDLSNDPQATIAAARAFLESFPAEPAAAAALVLGRNLFQAGDYNSARMTLEKIAATDPTPPRAQAAWLLAARAASLIPSPQSREEALPLFDHAIAINAPLRPIASMEKARLLIDLDHLGDAITLLRKWNDALPKDDALRLPVGFLLGEALIAQAEKTPALLSEVLDLYQKLLTHPQVDPATSYRLQYLRGQTLEQLPSPKNPAIKRVAEALEAYFSVLESAAKQAPAEWEWFERCGFRALELCEAAQRWQPAIAIAKKLASFHGPRAEEAAARARALQLKHMVWEDE
ncbi:MAG: tetratricopeptide repeat protein [Verrucomicrobia bacterium]|nr:MAG: tetratricopeptide repeat protein [Verrucomicrobiota bacterium]